MNRLEDPYELIRVGNPVPDPEALPGPETAAGHDIIFSILGDISETRVQAADDVETATATRTSQHASGRPRVLAFVASFLAVLAVGSISILLLVTGPSGDSAGPTGPTEINPAQDSPEQTPAETEPVSPEEPLPVYVLEHPSFEYVGGGASDDSFGTVVELQWEGEPGQVEITVFGLGSSDPAADIKAMAQEYVSDGYVIEEIDTDDRLVTHLLNEGGDHHYLWTEDGAVIRVRGFSLGEFASEVFDSLHRYPLDSEQVQSLLTGAEEPETETLRIPSGIALALDSTVSSLLTQSGRQLSSTDTSEEDGLQFESAAFSDGIGTVELIWQEWPTTVDFYSVLTNDTTIEQQDGHEVTLRRHPEDNTIEVGIFDGSIYARAYTTFTSDLSEADIRQLAQMLYNAVSEITTDE